MIDATGTKLARNGFSRPRNDFSAKTNPNRKGGLDSATMTPRGPQSEFSSKTNPQFGRVPLTEAQKDLANSHLSLARSLARQLHSRRYVELEEVESVAFVALVEAARCHDAESGAQFSTFARYRIVGAILDFFRKAGKNRHPQTSTMRGLWGTNLEVEQYGKPVGINPDLPVGTEFDSFDAFESHFRPMSAAQATACRLIYLEGKSQEEAAEIMDCTPSYISRIHREAMTMLFERLKGRRDLPSYTQPGRGNDAGHRGADAWCPVNPMRGRARMPRARALARAC